MMPDGAYHVVMSMPMYGAQGLAAAIMPAIRDNTPPAHREGRTGSRRQQLRQSDQCCRLCR